MRTGILFVALLMGLACFCRIAAAEPAKTPADPLETASWLAGGVWKAEIAPPNQPPTRIEMRAEKILGGKAISFSTRFNGVEQYRGFYTYDSAKKKVVFTYPSADGEITEGTVEQADGYLLLDFRITGDDGKVQHLQVRMVKADADHYTWTLYGGKEGDWKPVFALHYQRTEK